jgi:hypothetical protein
LSFILLKTILATIAGSRIRTKQLYKNIFIRKL